METLRKIGVSVVVLLITILLTFLTAIIFEGKMERDNATGWAEKAYWWSLVTHDGVEIGATHGPLKIALHPFAIYTNFPNQRTEHFTINSMGFRETGTTDIKKRQKRIVLVGGSEAFGTGLNGDHETIARFLEDTLEAEVINAAVIGHGSGQELSYLLMELIDLEPDLVLALDGHNDFVRYYNEQVTDARLLGTNNHFEQVESQLKALKRLRDASFLGRVANLHLVLFPRVSDQILRSKYFQGLTSPPEIENTEKRLLDPARAYAKNITKMSQMSSSFQYRFLCVLQPEKTHDPKYRAFREIVAHELRTHHVDYLDLGEMKELGEEMFMDEIHTDKLGNKLIAGQIAEAIMNNKLLSNDSLRGPEQPQGDASRRGK